MPAPDPATPLPTLELMARTDRDAASDVSGAATDEVLPAVPGDENRALTPGSTEGRRLPGPG